MRKIAVSSNVPSRIRFSARAEAQIVTEWFFDDDPSAVGAVRLAQLFHHQPEQHGRDGQVVRRPRAAPSSCRMA